VRRRVDWMVGLGREGREWRRMGPERARRMGMGEGLGSVGGLQKKIFIVGFWRYFHN
jgi:hypothetical protein